MAHTPGPWNVQSDGQIWCDDHPIVEKLCSGEWGDGAIDITTGKRFLAHCWGKVATDEAKANAHLIASAPTMLEALEEFARLEVPAKPEGNAGFYSIPFKRIEKAQAAVRLARGGE